MAGLVWFALGETDRAKELCEQALEINPDLDAVYGIRSLAKLIEGDEAGAAKDLKRAVQRNPAGANPYIMIALLELDRGDTAKAEAYCTRVIEAAEKNAEAWLIRGLVRAAAGKLFQGWVDTQQALKLNPNLKNLAPRRSAAEWLLYRSDAAHNRALRMQQRGKDPTRPFQRAVAHLDEAIDLDPDTGLKAELLRSRASVRINWASYKRIRYEDSTGDYEYALRDLDRSVGIDPSSVQSLTARGWARLQWAIYRIGRKEEATAHLKSAIDDLNVAAGLAPDDANILWRRGMCYEWMRNWAAAIRDFERAAELDPKLVQTFKLSWERAKALQRQE